MFIQMYDTYDWFKYTLHHFLKEIKAVKYASQNETVKVHLTIDEFAKALLIHCTQTSARC